MRNSDVVRAFVNGQDAAAGNLRAESGILYSYATPIAVNLGHCFMVNDTKYSVTTSRHQSLLRGKIDTAARQDGRYVDMARKQAGTRGRLTGSESWTRYV